jgi:hypothetical protein
MEAEYFSEKTNTYLQTYVASCHRRRKYICIVSNMKTSNLTSNQYHHNTLTAISAKYIKNTSKVISNTTLQILINTMTKKILINIITYVHTICVCFGVSTKRPHIISDSNLQKDRLEIQVMNHGTYRINLN